MHTVNAWTGGELPDLFFFMTTYVHLCTDIIQRTVLA